MNIMVAINPPYTDLICTKYKPIEFRKKVLSCMLETPEDVTLYIYETKNKGGSGKVIASSSLEVVEPIMCIHDPTNADDIIEVEYTRTRVLNKLHKHFVDIKESQKYENCANQFYNYLDDIGFGGDYAVVLKDVIKYDVPKELGEFCDLNGNALKRPPQNMFRML